MSGLLRAMDPIERLIFFPEKPLEADPSVVGLDFEEVWFRTDDGVRLHGWFVPGEGPETLIWFHGNAGNISHRVDNLRLLHDRVGAHVFLFDYRGYGRSEGSPSEQGVYRDARAAVAELRLRGDVDPGRFVYFGRSLGSAVAIDLAAEQPPARLVLETPFLSVRAMARTLLPGFLAALAGNRFDNESKIGAIQCPKLFIHGDRDEVVPFAQGRRLFELAPPPKDFFVIRGAGHNDTYVVGGERYFERLRLFVREGS